MKISLKLFALFLMMQSFTCAKEGDDDTNLKTSESLAVQKQEILVYINGFPCSPSIGCSSIAFGSKPCGGPWEYLIYSNAVNVVQLRTMVASYNAAEEAFNRQNGSVSDCMLVIAPPKLGCVNGKCGAVN